MMAAVAVMILGCADVPLDSGLVDASHCDKRCTAAQGARTRALRECGVPRASTMLACNERNVAAIECETACVTSQVCLFVSESSAGFKGNGARTYYDCLRECPPRE